MKPSTRPFALAAFLATATAALALGAARPAQAGDGVIELNHTCAASTGCVPGDAPGYPITLDGVAGRSYRMTSDLRVPTATDGIVISFSDARVDMGGFIIAQACTFPQSGQGVPLCTLDGDADGIRVTSNVAYGGTTVRDGTIYFMSGDGLFLGSDARIDDVTVRGNGGRGMYLGANSTVRHAIAEGNGGWGIYGHGTVMGSTARSNTRGISWTGTIANNTTIGNDAAGIWSGSNSTITANTSTDNEGSGIYCTSGCTISNNTSARNGNGVSDHGIECYGDCNVIGNNVVDSSGYGLQLYDGNSIFMQNNINDSGSGPVNGGINKGLNACDGGLCP